MKKRVFLLHKLQKNKVDCSLLRCSVHIGLLIFFVFGICYLRENYNVFVQCHPLCVFRYAMHCFWFIIGDGLFLKVERETSLHLVAWPTKD